jgi:glyoxylase-like metal-dependent hydrolase (beta-lactamase superfamily II)
MSLPQYEVFALRYGHLERTRNENFIQHDPHDGPMPMDYFVWVIRDDERTILVDTGYGAQEAAKRKRQLIRCPIDALGTIGIKGEAVTDVVLTHLHYDHAGNLGKVPRATFHVQDAEMAFVTGRYMRHDMLRHGYAVEDVVTLVRGLYEKRVTFHAGDDEMAPGVQLLHIGGHTRGLQAVRVHTKRGWVVLASDATHYYDNMNLAMPFPIVFNVGDMLEGFEKLQRAADSPDHIVPGHDPLVLQRFPMAKPEIDLVKLHEAPR